MICLKSHENWEHDLRFSNKSEEEQEMKRYSNYLQENL